MHFKVNSGSKVLFWQDVWCGENSLKSQFPDLFRLARFKDATVYQMLSWNGEQIHWNLSLVRSPNDWEEESVCNLLANLASVEIRSQESDELVWPHDPKGSFSIRSFCNALHNWPSSSDFPVLAIWRSKAPPKVFFFAWAAINDKIPTEDFFKRRNFMGLVGVFCVVRRKSRSITSWFIAVGCPRCGI